MELLQLRYFLVTARYEHITRAAEALCTSQPALSQSIRRLECELGTPLFDRSGRGIRLNDAGRFLQQKAEPLLEELDRLPEQLRCREAEKRRTVHLNVQAASCFITDCVLSYRQSRPDVSFQISCRENESDADIRIYASCPGGHSETGSRVLLHEDFYLAVPMASLLTARRAVRPEDLISADFICPGRSDSVRRFLEDFCSRSGFVPRIRCEAETPEDIRELVAGSMGVALWPQYSWKLPDTKGICLLPFRNSSCRRTVLVSADPQAGEPVQSFLRFLTCSVPSAAADPVSGSVPQSAAP